MQSFIVPFVEVDRLMEVSGCQSSVVKIPVSHMSHNNRWEHHYWCLMRPCGTISVKSRVLLVVPDYFCFENE